MKPVPTLGIKVPHLRCLRVRALRARWYVVSVILLIWFALSPALVHHDFAGTNFFLIPLATVVLALLVPTLPLKAASISLGLFAANFFLGPLSNRIGSSQFDTQFIYDPRERSKQFTLLLTGFGTAAVASCLCYLRLKFRKRVTQPVALQRRRSRLSRRSHFFHPKVSRVSPATLKR